MPVNLTVAIQPAHNFYVKYRVQRSKFSHGSYDARHVQLVTAFDTGGGCPSTELRGAILSRNRRYQAADARAALFASVRK